MTEKNARLWAPWRMAYIAESAGVEKSSDKLSDNSAAKTPPRSSSKIDDCIFCAFPSQPSSNDKKNLLLHRGEFCFVMLNKYPYNNGHLMIIPYKHTSDIIDVDPQTSADLWRLVCKCKTAIAAVMNPDGFNIGMNIGRTAGAGIDQHIHMHIVPRWNGDTNFMPVIGETKVISQSLDECYDVLKPYFG